MDDAMANASAAIAPSTLRACAKTANRSIVGLYDQVMTKRTGTKPMSPGDFDRHFGSLLADGEG
jgi:hypothetical protein